MNGTTLTSQLDAFRCGLLARLPAPEREAVLHADEGVRASNPGRKPPSLGEVVPGFALPDQHGRIVRLADRLAHGPVVLLFIRGGWCPFCTLTLRAYQAAFASMSELGADLLAITPQPADTCGAIAERDLLAFPMLSDQGNAVADAYGVAYALPPALHPLYLKLGHDLPRLNRTGDWRMPFPATFVVGSDGRVLHASVERVAHRRMEPDDVIGVLESLRVNA